MKESSQKKLKILGVGVSITTKSQVLSFVESSLKSKYKFFISTPNPEIVLKAQNDSELKEAIDESDIALPDGIGLTWAAKTLYVEKINRIQGRVMFEELLKLANRKKLKVFLLGSTKPSHEASMVKIGKLYPDLKVEGRYDIVVDNKGYSAIETDRKVHIDILKHINRFKPDILFVALGAPKQEKWVMHNLPNLDIGGAMVIGGTLDTFSGKISKPPSWMETAGLEWLWRLALEPQRFGRIFRATVVFPVAVLKERLAGYQ